MLMNILRLSYKGFIYNWRLSLCLLLGTLLASSILTGSLLVGDSVKKTLKSKAFERIGKFIRRCHVEIDLSLKIMLKRCHKHLTTPQSQEY